MNSMVVVMVRMIKLDRAQNSKQYRDDEHNPHNDGVCNATLHREVAIVRSVMSIAFPMADTLPPVHALSKPTARHDFI